MERLKNYAKYQVGLQSASEYQQTERQIHSEKELVNVKDKRANTRDSFHESDKEPKRAERQLSRAKQSLEFEYQQTFNALKRTTNSSTRQVSGTTIPHVVDLNKQKAQLQTLFNIKEEQYKVENKLHEKKRLIEKSRKLQDRIQSNLETSQQFHLVNSIHNLYQPGLDDKIANEQREALNNFYKSSKARESLDSDSDDEEDEKRAQRRANKRNERFERFSEDILGELRTQSCSERVATLSVDIPLVLPNTPSFDNQSASTTNTPLTKQLLPPLQVTDDELYSRLANLRA